MALEYVLVGGTKYPLSPAWREPIIPGHEMDYPVDINTATEENPASITITEGVEALPFQFYKFTDTVLSGEELAALSGTLTMTADTGSAEDEPIHNYGSAALSEFLNFFISMLSGAPVAFNGLEQDAANLCAGGEKLSVIAFPQSGTFHDTTGAVTVEVPAAGTYLGLFGNMTDYTLSGTVTVAKYHFDTRHTGEQIPVLTFGMIEAGALMGTGTGGTLDLTCYANLSEVLKKNMGRIICAQMAVPGQKMAIMPFAASVQDGMGVWLALDLGSAAIMQILYNPTEDTLSVTTSPLSGMLGN